MRAALSKHCLDRYRIHHPDASRQDVVDALYASTNIPPEIASSLVGRRPRETKDQFFLAPDCRGIFVVPEHNVVVTYLRLGLDAHRIAVKHWGTAKPRQTLGARTPEPDAPAPPTPPVEEEVIDIDPNLTLQELEERWAAAKESTQEATQHLQDLREDLCCTRGTERRLLLEGRISECKRDIGRLQRESGALRQAVQERRRADAAPHPDLGVSPHNIEIHDRLRELFGGVAAARRAVAGMRKTAATFDPESWTETVTLCDAASPLRVTVLIPHDSRTQAIADVA